MEEKKGNVPEATLKQSKEEFSASHNTSSPRPQTWKTSSFTSHYPPPNHLTGMFSDLIDRRLEVGDGRGGKSPLFLASLVGPLNPYSSKNIIHQMAKSYSSVATLLQGIMG